MGYALTRAAIAAGHKVTLITGPTALRPPEKTKIVKVETGTQMFDAVKMHFDKCDCLVMAAAVADYTPAGKSKAKIKKGAGSLTLEFKTTPDIAKWAGQNKKNQIVVGFALEDKSIRKNAERKLKEKNLDMVIANTTAAIAADKTSAQSKTPSGKWLKMQTAGKSAIASRIIRLIEKLPTRKGDYRK
jgi:phosphopantothenoylcysteine decarboxylase/phosphopantothenate--cysteine ligase